MAPVSRVWVVPGLTRERRIDPAEKVTDFSDAFFALTREMKPFTLHDRGFQDLFLVVNFSLFPLLTPSVNALPIKIPILWRI